jgi:hypothetical protein
MKFPLGFSSTLARTLEGERFGLGADGLGKEFRQPSFGADDARRETTSRKSKWQQVRVPTCVRSTKYKYTDDDFSSMVLVKGA